MRKTNVQFLVDAMDFSRYGPLAQAFVLEAMRRYADQVAKADPAIFDNAFIAGEAWVGVAKELQFKLNQHLHQK